MAPGERAPRRGLPRVRGGDPWPPEGSEPASAADPDGMEEGRSRQIAAPRRSRQGLPRTPGAAQRTGPGGSQPQVAAVSQREAPPASGERALAERRVRRWARSRWAGVAVAGLIAAVTVVALAARWLLARDVMRDFVAAHPGEYPLPHGAPLGLPVWLNWSHFFSAFLMILIIRTGLQVRHERRPPAFWTPKGNDTGKVSLTVWLHQSLDLLWIVNGLVFFVLLFVTGQWMRIVPTSWEVLPNALSAALQYASLDWPTENGWINYNSLQQLAYFVTVFVAAPLALASGLRMSALWPQSAPTLNRIYPSWLARAIHVRVMLYFVAFIVVHVVLVCATGVLTNLDHMFAARGTTGPGRHGSDWTGLLLFLGSMAITVAALMAAARPLLIAPVASVFGKVTRR